MLSLPRRPLGRSNADKEAQYQGELARFCKLILEIRSTLDFAVGARGWGYLLEEHGLGKDEFDALAALITECRKSGALPLDIVAEDGARAFANLEDLDDDDPAAKADRIVDYVRHAHLHYNPLSFWSTQSTYVEMLVEKVDLKSLFEPVCAEFFVPIANERGWPDLNSRVAMMRQFAKHEAAGREIVLLYCGDFDPTGLKISDSYHKMLDELAGAAEWRPTNLKVVRFGLNEPFIRQHRLTWIASLKTGSGKDLADPSHPNHRDQHVQVYLKRYGARKCEANALVVRPDAGRALCRRAIKQFVSDRGITRYQRALTKQQSLVAAEVKRLLARGSEAHDPN